MAPNQDVHHRVSQESTSDEQTIHDFPAEAAKAGRKLVGIDGKWYDVTNFINRHPGGPVINHFIGNDASTVFHAYGHSDLLLKHRKPVGTYTRQYQHPADKDFHNLLIEFKQRGFFETDWSFYSGVFAVCAIELAMVFLLVAWCDVWYWRYAGAIMLYVFWEQCGFLMHDFMHIQVFRNNFWDRFFGTFFGTVCFGISAHWWKDDHDIHHSVTNMVDIKKNFVDPQADEVVWAQHPTMLPLHKGIIKKYLIKIQHITFLPVVVIFGRIAMQIDSYQTETRWYQWVAIALHWIWISFLLSFIPTWQELAVFYAIASLLQGLLHLKLVVSHYSSPFLLDNEFHSASWFEHMLRTTINISNPPWMDWFFGGLDFHIEHHFFPKMARGRFREASRRIREICIKHDLHYVSISFSQAMKRILIGLKSTSTHYSLDPR